jgi:hypothetical protein
VLDEWESAHARWVEVEPRAAAVAKRCAIGVAVHLGGAFLGLVWLSGWAREGAAALAYALLLGVPGALLLLYGLVKRALHLVLCLRPDARAFLALDEGGIRWQSAWARAYLPIDDLAELRLVRRAFARRDLLFGTRDPSTRRRMVLLDRRAIAEAERLIDAVQVRRDRAPEGAPAGAERLLRAGQSWREWLDRLGDLASRPSGGGSYRDAEIGADALFAIVRSWREHPELRAGAAYVLARQRRASHLVELVELLQPSSPPLVTVMVALAVDGRATVPAEQLAEALRFVDDELRALTAERRRAD